ncbi:MAG: hypothetical protein ACKON8_04765 [Planctomycetota bacterium]
MNTRNRFGSAHVTALAAVAILSATVARAEVLVNYSISSTSGTVSIPPTTLAAGITATDITRGSGLTPISLNRGYSSQGWNNSGTTTTTRADAIAGNKFYTFSLTIASGSIASFNDITVGLYKSAITSPASMEWQYSFDNFVTTGSTLTTFNHYGRNSGTAPVPLVPDQWMTIDTGGQSNGNPTPALDISTVSALQNVAGPATVSFRLYGWGSINGNATTPTNTLAIGRDTGPLINGSIVPEPASICLVASAAGIGGLIRIRRRRNES